LTSVPLAEGSKGDGDVASFWFDGELGDRLVKLWRY